MNSSLQKAESLKARKVASGALPVTCLTAYDYATGRILDEAGIDFILVGDSLGMVVLGYPDTTHVTMHHMLHHVAAVARGVEKAFIVGDLPIHSYDTPEQALSNALLLIEAGADAVKLEGGIDQAEKVKTIVDAGIPVVGHLGMLPQSVLEEGGYKKKGKTDRELEILKQDALALQSAGVCAIVLESVIYTSALEITKSIDIPTIGIGCSSKDKEAPESCDGEVAVISDLIGSYPWFVPPFATPRASVAEDTSRAVKEYIQSVRS
ncbi:3-methyl-2-oxobutanoate hydroxymethyltransferase [Akkermansiaceae bacterium]|nr:3-methyl-2-oxobutanoate hydroxymethyltransferase [Akkermansiaceae bacterium]